MPKFEYTALDARGAESSGTVEAATQNDVVTQLRQQGFFPTSVVPEGQVKKAAKTIKAANKTVAAARVSQKNFSVLDFTFAPFAKPLRLLRPDVRIQPGRIPGADKDSPQLAWPHVR